MDSCREGWGLHLRPGAPILVHTENEWRQRTRSGGLVRGEVKHHLMSTHGVAGEDPELPQNCSLLVFSPTPEQRWHSPFQSPRCCCKHSVWQARADLWCQRGSPSDCGWASSPLHPPGDYFIHMWNNHVWKAEIQLLPPLATAVLDTAPRGTNRDILHFPLFCVFSDILEHGTPKPPADSVDFLITESHLQSGDWKHKTEVETVSLKLRDWNKGSKPIKPRNQRFSCFTWIRMMGKSRGVWLIGVPSG